MTFFNRLRELVNGSDETISELGTRTLALHSKMAEMVFGKISVHRGTIIMREDVTNPRTTHERCRIHLITEAFGHTLATFATFRRPKDKKGTWLLEHVVDFAIEHPMGLGVSYEFQCYEDDKTELFAKLKPSGLDTNFPKTIKGTSWNDREIT